MGSIQGFGFGWDVFSPALADILYLLVGLAAVLNRVLCKAR
ncbi:hypothetical protein [Gloeocapsopsis dulcis]|nr:hypothetical protein [Gloeocapsopsis dulcis]WNN87736.1 hypothetical protein P0S91_15585 [Gloeocapsopsis dulcis]